MMRKVLLTSCLLASAAHVDAALYDRGNGLIYDDVLDITWMADANYAQTSGYAAANANGVTIKSNGRMDWYEAMAWADQLEYAGHDDWRLPTLRPVNGVAFNYSVTYDGSTDRTYNHYFAGSELAYMYYVNLGNIAAFYPDGSDNPNASGLNISSSYASGGDPSDMRSVANLKAFLYWYGSIAQGIGNDEEYAWAMGTINGMQEIYHHNENQWTGINTFYAWAVHDGDIGANPIPTPPAMFLFFSSLLCLLGSRCRKTIA